MAATTGHAQIVSNVTTPFTHGATVTITGSSFGVDDHPGPVIWDNLEDGTCNSAATIGSWTSVNALVIGSESRHANSSRCATNNFQGNQYIWPPQYPRDSGHGDTGCFDYNTVSRTGSWFISYWFKLDSNWTWGTAPNTNLSNVKFGGRFWGHASSPQEDFVIATIGASGNTWQYQTENVTNHGGENYLHPGGPEDWGLNVWHLSQVEFRDNTFVNGVAQNDGVFRYWLDGALMKENTHIKTREDDAGYKDCNNIGLYNSHDSNETDRNDFYLDDAYIDDSWARVEIGNAPVYSQCTLREVQIPTTWAQGSITVTANLGSFPSVDGVYLFVVTPSGAVSSGYALGGADLGPPGVPTVPEWIE